MDTFVEKPDHDHDHPSASGEEGDLTHDPSPQPIERVPTYLQPSMPIKERLRHFTFAWYTLTMSTAGIGLVLGATPNRFKGLDVIGLIVFIFALFMFILISTLLICRFILFKNTFRRCFTHPREALLVPTFFLTIASLLSGAEHWGSVFLNDHKFAGLCRFLKVMYWIYLGCTFLFSIVAYTILFTRKEEVRLKAPAMTPAWILPIFPIMLAGTIAAAICSTLKPSQSLMVIASGTAAQGLGFLVSTFLYATYINRLMIYGLPEHRPAMFIAVGPPSFTCAALIAMANDIPRIFESDIAFVKSFTYPGPVAEATRIAAIYLCLFLWGLSFWFFTLALVALPGIPDRKFHLSWWTFVFPNVGFTVSTIRVGTVMDSAGLRMFSTVLSLIIVMVWIFVGLRCFYAVYKREIIWPGHDEDS
ncbi:hypothetical protein SLS53_008606 [Cytospora paraplurivora]|uniref:Malic acid transport protein n=1 Tax=Cytospora paraplurivora TaxID=2898453 RepID=A0AAN9U0Q7_9PEZI